MLPWQRKTHAKSPESKNNDDEINRVGQKHEDVNVSHSAVFWVNEVIEELTNRNVDLQDSVHRETHICDI